MSSNTLVDQVQADVMRLRQAGRSYTEIQEELGISRATISRSLKAAQAPETETSPDPSGGSRSASGATSTPDVLPPLEESGIPVEPYSELITNCLAGLRELTASESSRFLKNQMAGFTTDLEQRSSALLKMLRLKLMRSARQRAAIPRQERGKLERLQREITAAEVKLENLEIAVSTGGGPSGDVERPERHIPYCKEALEALRQRAAVQEQRVREVEASTN